MKFIQLSKYFQKIENTTLRLKITKILADLFKNLSVDEIDKTLYLLQGRLTPLYEKLEFGMGEKMIIKAICLALNLEKNYFEKEFKKIGDLGYTIEEFKRQITSFEKKELTINQVYDELWKIAKAEGEGSQEIKFKILANLIRWLDPLSCRYLVRIPIGVLRLGFSDMTVLDAFSWMLVNNKGLRKIIEKAYHVRPDIGYIGRIIKESGIEGLKNIKPKVFTPILMMRAERVANFSEILEKIGQCAIEEKFDGFRLQIHYERDKNLVKLFSRNLEEVTYMYPDIAKGIKNDLKGDQLILEGEAIGFDPVRKHFLSFQETVKRKRKYNIEEKAKKIPLKLFLFELLYINGENLLDKPFKERRKKLEAIIKSSKDNFKNTIFLAHQEIVNRDQQIEKLFNQAIAKDLEGIIAKKLDGYYQPGARGWNWIKLKKSYTAKIKDTIDCLVMGYDLGKGKRADFGMGAFLVGIYDEKDDCYVTVAKIGTGLSDDEWKNLKIESEKFKTQRKPNQYLVDKTMECDIWLMPAIVVEIRADEITRSPVHTAGRKMKPSKTGIAFEVDIPGFALRFPRLERFRSDKKPDEVTNLRELEKIYNMQTR